MLKKPLPKTGFLQLFLQKADFKPISKDLDEAAVPGKPCNQMNVNNLF